MIGVIFFGGFVGCVSVLIDDGVGGMIDSDVMLDEIDGVIVIVNGGFDGLFVGFEVVYEMVVIGFVLLVDVVIFEVFGGS